MRPPKTRDEAIEYIYWRYGVALGGYVSCNAQTSWGTILITPDGFSWLSGNPATVEWVSQSEGELWM